MARPTPTRLPRAGTATGIPRDCLYRLPETFLRTMRRWTLDRDALRLLHVVLYRTCRACPDQWGAPGPHPEEDFGEAFSNIHTWQGTRPDRGHGAIIAAAARLRVTGAFERIGPCRGNGGLRWRLTETAFAGLFADDRYGYLDIRVLPYLRVVTALTLLGEIALVRGMPRPQLRFDVEDLHRAGGLKEPISWKPVRRLLLRALEAIAGVHRLRVVLGLACHHRLVGADTVYLRLEHARSGWSTGALGRFDTRVREVVVIDPDGTRRMRPDALPAYLEGRQRMPA